MEQQPSPRRGSMRIALVTAAAAAFAAAGSGCSSASDDADTLSVYCVDDGRRVVDDDNCDDRVGTARGYHLWHKSGRHSYKLGSKVAPGELIPPGDTSGRSRLGLPPTGPVKSGIIQRGGIGNDSAHSSGG